MLGRMSKNEGGIFPALLRHWRTKRGLSQLDLAVSADVSSRHLSFLETGRAQPSREMVLRLGATLDVPLRDQNELLRAAGFPPEYGEPSVHDGLPAPIAQALERMIAVHDPFPITVLDRHYDVLRVNDGGARLFSRFVAEPAALPARLNVYRLLFDPRLVRPFVADWERVAHAMVARLHREALARTQDPALGALVRALLEYPGVPEAWRQPDFSAPAEPALTVRLRRDELDLSFLTAVTAFNAPGNVTLDELRIESYFPLDRATEQACLRLADRP
jgi:transcriptional regulator with XRE-family HTH domain